MRWTKQFKLKNKKFAIHWFKKINMDPDTAPFPEQFFELLQTLLTAVHDVFPECNKTVDALKELEVIADLGMEEMKVTLINAWYETMKPYITECVQKHDAVLLQANIEILDKLDLKSKWTDPDFYPESKEIMWEYINRLNYLACMFVESTPEQIQNLHTTASKIMEAGNIEFSDDGKITVDMAAITRNPGELMGMMSSILPMMMGDGGDAPANGLQSILQATMKNMLKQQGGPN